MEQFVIKRLEYNIIVDPIIECFGVLFALAGFSLNKERCNGKYIKKAKKYFGDFKDHKLVEMFKEHLKNNGCFKYNGSVELALCISQNVEPSKELLKETYFDMKSFKKFKSEVFKFVKESKFEEFFHNNYNDYALNIERFYNTINKYNPQEYLFNFLGLRNDNLNILLMFLITTANYGVNIGDRLYCCIRPYKQSVYRNDIDFAYDMPYVTSLILHEFAHSFINPLTSKYIKNYQNINKQLFKEIFDKQPYGEHVETAINELIIRAIECMYVEEVFPEQYNDFKKDYIDEGFVKIDLIENIFQIYRKSEHKNIKDIYPKILSSLLVT